LARHSDARTARIHVSFNPHLLRVVIKDDGNGINPANSRPDGRGLRNMQQRVDELGGTLKRGNVKGTAYCLRIPLPLQRRTNLVNSDDT
jgi:signal transduction histidine kinase